jgi:hypothetical protein
MRIMRLVRLCADSSVLFEWDLGILAKSLLFIRALAALFSQLVDLSSIFAVFAGRLSLWLSDFPLRHLLI